MIDGERRGPFPLERLPEEGVHPSTYVWSKGMADWEKAEDVAEICRFYRGRLYDIMHPAPVAPPEEVQQMPQQSGESDTRHRLGAMHGVELPTLEEIDSHEDTSVKPRSMLVPAILATFFFCPPIGIFAIYLAVASKKCWKNSLKFNDNSPASGQSALSELHQDMRININRREPTSSDWRRLAHDYARAAKMWSGIAFFVGIIIYSFLFFKM